MQKQEHDEKQHTQSITKQNKIQQNNGTTEEKVTRSESNALARNLNTKQT